MPIPAESNTAIPVHPDFPNLVVVDHPFIQIKLTEAREKGTPHWRFCTIVHEIASLMLYECTRDWPTEGRVIETPLEEMEGAQAAQFLTLVPILRAGLGMVRGMVDLMPEARVGHVGLFRDHESLEPVEYYKRFPRNMGDGRILLLDPMLATGGSAVAAVNVIKEECGRGGREVDIRMVCLVASPEGVARMGEAHGDVPIYAAALDRELNEVGYILPGLGDAGDRIFGTEV